MANYYCTSRTNYFRVKDNDAFTAWAKNNKLELANKGDAYAIIGCEGNDAGSLEVYAEQEDGDLVALDFCDELAKHLAQGEVAVVVEAGAEKARYVCGFAIALNHEGKQICVSIDDIYEKAKRKFGALPSRAEY